MLILTDCLVIMATVTLAYVGRFGLEGEALGRASIGVPAGVMAVLWLLSIWGCGGYDRRLFGTGGEEYRNVARATGLCFGLVAIAAYVTKTDIARGFVLVAFPLGLCLLLLSRYGVRRVLQRGRRRRGTFTYRVLVVGTERGVRDLVRTLARSPGDGYQPVAAWVPGPNDPVTTRGPTKPVVVPIVTGGQDVRAPCRTFAADMVAVTGEEGLPGRGLKDLAWQLEGTGVDLVVAPSLVDVAGPRVTVRTAGGSSLLHIDEPMFSGAHRLVKASFDRCLAGFALLLLFPLLVSLAVAVRMSSPGPALFRQTRVGLGGRHFQMYKFRSMVNDAEAQLDQHRDRNEADGPLFKIRDDERITGVGRLLRRTSLDELPQLWNVVRGDMSLVGPRPPLPSEVAQYDEDVGRRLLVQPGMTGLWQVSGRAALDWEESVRLDLYYVENWSLGLDVFLLLRTVRSVVRGDGAY